MRLFIPGPVNVEEDVLKVMSSPMISHRSKSASCLQQSISENMQILWNRSAKGLQKVPCLRPL